MPRWLSRDRFAFLLAVTAPLVVSLVLVPWRDRLENTHLALILVVTVVAVAAIGNRVAGYLAALLAGLWFDFFFTEPFQRFTIADRSDIETTILLLIVGVAVTELAVWGRRQEAKAGREAGYLAGIEAAAAVGAVGGPSQALIKQVSDQLVVILGLRECRYQLGVAGVGSPPRLRRDGSVVWNGAAWDVEHRGLPADVETELLVENGGRLHGRYLLSASSSARPLSLEQRRVAVTLADQVGAALG